MANSLIVMPFNAELSDWLAEQGVPVDGLAAGLAPTVGLLVTIVRDLGWPCEPTDLTGWWNANIGGRAGSYPPVSDLQLHDGSLSFRLGPLYGPWQVCRRVATECGPQVAVEAGGGDAVVVTGTTSYEDFHQGLAGCPPRADGLDREWSRPPSAEDRFRNGYSELNAQRSEGREVPLEECLAYAISGRIGCGSEAMTVGWAIQARRRVDALVESLRSHLAEASVPIPELVWAFGQSEGCQPDLRRLVERLRDVPGAGPSREMAEVFLRSSPADR